MPSVGKIVKFFTANSVSRKGEEGNRQTFFPAASPLDPRGRVRVGVEAEHCRDKTYQAKTLSNSSSVVCQAQNMRGKHLSYLLLHRSL